MIIEDSRILECVNQEKMKALEREIMLFVNQKLYEKGHITEEMYHKAKDEFLR